MYVFFLSDTSLVKHCLQPREGTQVPSAQVALGTQGAVPGQATSGGLSTIHLSASSTLDVATSSLAIKVGQEGPMSHTSHTKDTRRDQLYCSQMVSFHNYTSSKKWMSMWL